MQSNMKRFTYIFGISMALIMGLSVILPALSTNVSPIQQIPPTAVPEPTPIPPPDINAISFNQTYLHPSGIFTVAQPTGWLPAAPQNTLNNVQATLSNSTAQSIIQVEVTRPDAETEAPLTLDEVDAQFTSSALASSWARYSSWSETGRRRENDQLLLDFTLTSGNQTFVARQKSWADGDLIRSVRVVTPENATEALLYLLDEVSDSLTVVPEFTSTPLDWNAHYDTVNGNIIRFPSNWTVADTAPGQPTSITDDTGTVTLRMETRAEPVADEAAAEAFVVAQRPGASILNIAPVSRESAEGYAVAYEFTTVDGDTQSGLAVLLNGADGQLHVANLRFAGAGIDLTTESADGDNAGLAAVADTFYVLPGLVASTLEDAAE